MIRSILATSFVLLLVLFSGCAFDTGVGDPATALVDPRLEGVWKGEGESGTILVKAWDAHTYAISVVNIDSSPGAVKYKPGECYKAWLTKIEGRTFISLDSTPHDLKPPEHPFLVAMLEVKPDGIKVQALNPEVCGEARTPAALEASIKANLNNPKLFLPTVAYQRITDEVKKELSR